MMKTYGDLKRYLQDTLNSIEEVSDDKELSITCNTYGQYGRLLSIPSVGFINLDTLNEEEDNEDY